MFCVDMSLVKPATINDFALIADDLKLGRGEEDLKQYHSD